MYLSAGENVLPSVKPTSQPVDNYDNMVSWTKHVNTMSARRNKADQSLTLFSGQRPCCREASRCSKPWGRHQWRLTKKGGLPVRDLWQLERTAEWGAERERRVHVRGEHGSSAGLRFPEKDPWPGASPQRQWVTSFYLKKWRSCRLQRQNKTT